MELKYNSVKSETVRVNLHFGQKLHVAHPKFSVYERFAHEHAVAVPVTSRKQSTL